MGRVSSWLLPDSLSPVPSKVILGEPKFHRSPLFYILLAILLLLLICLILLVLFRKHIKIFELAKFRQKTKGEAATPEYFSGNLRTISYFKFQTLKKATKNFHAQNLLGSGGFGPVYKGKLVDGRMIAVKQLSLDKSQQGETEFLAEAWKLYERSNVLELVDPKLRQDGFVEKDVLQAIHVAFLCLQAYPTMRPPMSQIVAMLTCKVELVSTPTKPVFMERMRRKPDDNLSWETISGSFPSPILSDSSHIK
ncbi:hypothetical protein FRX31_021626 [Thalictrum thalictroides]|uniref:Uncharacterized protein n=1 Tax=Thalictrum thalictroides TaxID=46969 RepID=A0A7J6VUK6_THATH|nr:hypothetical protein FRX31_021626 [Thalictrum thalictroides]